LPPLAAALCAVQASANTRRYATSTPQCCIVTTVYYAIGQHTKKVPLPWDLDNTLNCILIISTVFAGLPIIAKRHTDGPSCAIYSNRSHNQCGEVALTCDIIYVASLLSRLAF